MSDQLAEQPAEEKKDADKPSGGGQPNPQGGIDPELEKKAKLAKIKEENDNAISLGGPIKKKKKIHSFYEPPLEKPDEKFDPEVKRQNELLRRWKVHIFQIEVVNMTKDPIDPFLQIIIGGNYYIDIKKISGGNLQYTPVGEKGIVYQTDMLKIVEPNENNRIFETQIISEYRASYFDLMQQNLHIELWNSMGPLFLNRFLGYASIPLIEVANGKFKQGLQIYPVGDDTVQRQVAAISFTIYFEEIWDFYLTFMDWKTTTLENDLDKEMLYHPSVELRLLSPNSIDNTVQSPVVKNTKLPHWAMIEPGLKYRGTFTELRHEKLQINLWHNQNMGRSLIGTKTIPLKSCLEINFVKTEMVIHKNRGGGNKDQAKKKVTTVANIQGTLRVGKKPKFAQFGDMDIIAKQEQYLAVQVQRLAVFDALDEAGGDVSVFATVDWSGTQKKTKSVRRPNVNDTLMFHIPIEEEYRVGDPARLAEFLSDELATKSEIVLNVWADTGKSNLENLGSMKVCLREIHFQKFEDKQFTDDRTKQKISCQCRVYTTTTKLQSAFFDTANSAVTLSLWFQPEVPYPGVDLGKLQPKSEDTYPSEFEKNLKHGVYQSRFNEALQKNFPVEYSIDDRRFDNLFYSDQYRQKHLLPLFLSRISPPDQNVITYAPNDFKDQFEIIDQVISRGIRTFSEVAHFVKCIPFRGSQEYQVDRVWSSPDFVLTMHLASVEEHALLMASMFRAVKYETINDLPSSDSIKKPKSNKKNDEDSTTEDRVFVCLGRARDTGQHHAWVMTISKDFDSVTLWEPTSGQQFHLPGRVQESEIPKLREYLCPPSVFTSDQLKEMNAHINLQRQESKSLIEELEGTEMEFDSEDQKPQNQHKRHAFAGNHQGQADYDDENDEDDEQASDFMEGIERIVYYEDLDQKYKGPNINYVGKIKALSKERQEQLKDLDYFSDEEQALNNINGGGNKQGQKGNRKPNKFLDQQEKERIAKDAQKKDKHLYPKEKFKDTKTGSEVPANPLKVPYSHLDLIFNHKNVWANLQNEHPCCLEYHIHNNRQWLPLISDPAILNTLLKKGDNQSIDIPKPSLVESRSQGHYLKSFMPFYDPKGMEPPILNQQVVKQEAYIMKEVEIAIKQVRSRKNLASKVRKNQYTQYALRLQLDFLEDSACQRFKDGEDKKQAQEFVQNELLKLIPQDYRIGLLPCSFNYTDADRIRTMIVDNAEDFLLNRSSSQGQQQSSANSKKIMFAIGVKIYPFNNNISSVRVAIASMSPLDNKSKQKQQQQTQQQTQQDK